MGLRVPVRRSADLRIPPGALTDGLEGDQWPVARRRRLHGPRPGVDVLEQGPGPECRDTDHGHDWSHKTAASMAHNLRSVAEALRRNPIEPRK